MQYAPADAKDDEIGKLVLKTLTQYAPDLPSAVIDQRVIRPGNLDHAELALDQILFMRPVPECARYDTPIENLFVCGPGTHPGRVIAGGSGRLAARRVLGS